MKLVRNSPKYDKCFLHNLPLTHLSDSSLSNFINKPLVIVNVLYVILTDLILPIFKQQFYICKDKLGFSYFSKPLWTKLQELAFRDVSHYFTAVQKNILQQLTLSNKLFGTYSIRFQPKCSTKSGIRLISLLNKTIPCGMKLDLPINLKLVPTAAILTTVHKNSKFTNPYPIKGKKISRSS